MTEHLDLHSEQAENRLETYKNDGIRLQELSLELAKAKVELQESDIYKKTLALEEEIKKTEERVNAFKESVKDSMEVNGIEKLELKTHKFTLKKNPWSLVVEDEKVVGSDYFEVKTTLNKTKLKKDIKDGTVSYPWVYISESTSLLITEK